MPISIAVSSEAQASYAAESAITRVIGALGNNVVADLLRVTRSQPSRWRSGKERPSPESRKRIADLDHVLDRLLLELHPEQVGPWLTGSNPHLAGARPIDVLQLRGAAAVLPAIDALAAGAYA
jgi:transcriptional regulator with XRE-family HTH domain